MAITPLTGFKAFTFDGEKSTDYGVQILGEGVFNAPEREVEMINIPGRNGAFALDKGRFENIEVTYPANIIADSTADFAAAVSDLRNMLCSRRGYVRLQDDYHPDEYRMAVYKEGLEVDEKVLRAGEFDITFDCKPQRYLLSGEEPITIGEWHETETASGEIASFEAEAGDAVKSLVADIEPIQSLNGYDKPWSGGAGKNKASLVDGTRTSQGITGTVSNQVISASGTATSTNANINNLNSINITSGQTYTVRLSKAVSNTISFKFVTDISEATAQHVSIASGSTSATFTANENFKFFRIYISGLTSGDTVSISGLQVLVGEGNISAFEPYSNICPISGWTEAKVTRTGKNLATVNSGNNIVVGKVKKGVTYTFSAHNSGAIGYALRKNRQTGAMVVAIPSALTDPVVSLTFTADEDFNLFLNGYGSGGSFADLASLYQLEVGSTATAYEPYNGNTYTTNLNGTRYGGTLDVASGVLTVDREYIQLNANEWSLETISGHQCFQSSASGNRASSGYPSGICNAFTVVDSYSAVGNNNSSIGINTARTLIRCDSFLSVDDLVSFINTNGIALCVELATPTTVQLTAQEVELLVGLNQIWANSGDVSVEYGTAPNVLVNPTLFESSPMLEVEGYGSININDDTVAIQNEELGTIKISGSQGIGSSMPLDTAQLNNGDTIFYNSAPYADVKVKANSGKLRITRNGAPTNGSCSISNISTNTAHVIVRPSETTFSKGTGKTVTTTVPLYVSVNDTVTSCTLTLTTSYSASTEKVTLSASWTSAPSTIHTSNEYRHNQYYGDSTKSILPSPMYIDLDIGEAYGVIDNEPLSFDNLVTLPAELPKLKSGVNTITADNTVTDLKVIPRWWKI